MEHDFSGRSSGTFPVATEHLKRKSCFSGRNVPNENSISISSKLSLIPASGLRGSFPVNGTDLICTYGKRDSGTKFTSPEVCVPFA